MGYHKATSILQTKYGKTSEVVTLHVQHIMQLPVVFGKNAVKVRGFYEKFVNHVKALETMGKIQEIYGIACLLIDKLPGIKAELVINDDD